MQAYPRRVQPGMWTLRNRNWGVLKIQTFAGCKLLQHPHAPRRDDNSLTSKKPVVSVSNAEGCGTTDRYGGWSSWKKETEAANDPKCCKDGIHRAASRFQHPPATPTQPANASLRGKALNYLRAAAPAADPGRIGKNWQKNVSVRCTLRLLTFLLCTNCHV